MVLTRIQKRNLERRKKDTETLIRAFGEKAKITIKTAGTKEAGRTVTLSERKREIETQQSRARALETKKIVMPQQVLQAQRELAPKKEVASIRTPISNKRIFLGTLSGTRLVQKLGGFKETTVGELEEAKPSLILSEAEKKRRAEKVITVPAQFVEVPKTKTEKATFFGNIINKFDKKIKLNQREIKNLNALDPRGQLLRVANVGLAIDKGLVRGVQTFDSINEFLLRKAANIDPNKALIGASRKLQDKNILNRNVNRAKEFSKFVVENPEAVKKALKTTAKVAGVAIGNLLVNEAKEFRRNPSVYVAEFVGEAIVFDRALKVAGRLTGLAKAKTVSKAAVSKASSQVDDLVKQSQKLKPKTRAQRDTLREINKEISRTKRELAKLKRKVKIAPKKTKKELVKITKEAEKAKKEAKKLAIAKQKAAVKIKKQVAKKITKLNKERSKFNKVIDNIVKKDNALLGSRRKIKGLAKDKRLLNNIDKRIEVLKKLDDIERKIRNTIKIKRGFGVKDLKKEFKVLGKIADLKRSIRKDKSLKVALSKKIIKVKKKVAVKVNEKKEFKKFIDNLRKEARVIEKAEFARIKRARIGLAKAKRAIKKIKIKKVNDELNKFNIFSVKVIKRLDVLKKKIAKSKFSKNIVKSLKKIDKRKDILKQINKLEKELTVTRVKFKDFINKLKLRVSKKVKVKAPKKIKLREKLPVVKINEKGFVSVIRGSNESLRKIKEASVNSLRNASKIIKNYVREQKKIKVLAKQVDNDIKRILNFDKNLKKQVKIAVKEAKRLGKLKVKREKLAKIKGEISSLRSQLGEVDNRIKLLRSFALKGNKAIVSQSDATVAVKRFMNKIGKLERKRRRNRIKRLFNDKLSAPKKVEDKVISRVEGRLPSGIVSNRLVLEVLTEEKPVVDLIKGVGVGVGDSQVRDTFVRGVRDAIGVLVTRFKGKAKIDPNFRFVAVIKPGGKVEPIKEPTVKKKPSIVAKPSPVVKPAPVAKPRRRAKPRAKPVAKPKAVIKPMVRIRPVAKPKIVTRVKPKRRIIKLPKLRPFKKKEVKIIKALLRVVPEKFRPSLKAVVLGITAARIPEVITGLEIRPIIIKLAKEKEEELKKKAKKKRGVKKSGKKRKVKRTKNGRK